MFFPKPYLAALTVNILLAHSLIPMVPLKHTAAIFFIFLCLAVKAQPNALYTYQQLSGTYYAFQRDSLKKAWDCPEIYNTKATQRKYKEIWDSRTDFITAAINDQDYVYEPTVFGYLQGIINQIVKANPQDLPVTPLLLIDRSSSANAYAIGGNVIAVNLGLVDFAQ